MGIPREEGKEPIVLDMATAAFPCELTACRSNVGIAAGGSKHDVPEHHNITIKTVNQLSTFNVPIVTA